jgi:hypothetical protein
MKKKAAVRKKVPRIPRTNPVLTAAQNLIRSQAEQISTQEILIGSIKQNYADQKLELETVKVELGSRILELEAKLGDATFEIGRLTSHNLLLEAAAARVPERPPFETPRTVFTRPFSG